VLSRSGANCVNSACNHRSRSSTVASQLGPGGGRVFSFIGGVITLLDSGVLLGVTGVIDGVFTMGDFWQAVINNV